MEATFFLLLPPPVATGGLLRLLDFRSLDFGDFVTECCSFLFTVLADCFVAAVFCDIDCLIGLFLCDEWVISDPLCFTILPPCLGNAGNLSLSLEIDFLVEVNLPRKSSNSDTGGSCACSCVGGYFRYLSDRGRYNNKERERERYSKKMHILSAG